MILHLRKVLVEPPVALNAAEISVRHWQSPADQAAWLTLRNRAIADLKPQPRAWTEADFAAEMTGKPWWFPERMWLASDLGSPARLLGSVTLAARGEGQSVVHWLLVERAARRQGIGRLLMSHLERAAWDSGARELQLETHPRWMAAVAFYTASGYLPVESSASRAEC